VYERITPVILTYNEASNIARTLDQVSWARRVVVVDSYSNDSTLETLSRYPSVTVYQRAFDSHAEQWNFALTKTGIETEWVLALDADFVLSEGLVNELGRLDPQVDATGFEASFEYCIFGRALRGSLYPPVTILYRRRGAYYVQEGHTQRVRVDGKVQPLCGTVYHDDRKSLSHWIAAQSRYMRLEAERLVHSGTPEKIRWQDRLRKLRFIAPFGVLLHCLFVRGLIFDGRAGLYYAIQRSVAEALLSLYLLERDLQSFDAARRKER
jgi:glycosyltransferase involved in cell wall biosynthesis